LPGNDRLPASFVPSRFGIGRLARLALPRAGSLACPVCFHPDLFVVIQIQYFKSEIVGSFGMDQIGFIGHRKIIAEKIAHGLEIRSVCSR
jgi:hypothetical protein